MQRPGSGAAKRLANSGAEGRQGGGLRIKPHRVGQAPAVSSQRSPVASSKWLSCASTRQEANQLTIQFPRVYRPAPQFQAQVVHWPAASEQGASIAPHLRKHGTLVISSVSAWDVLFPPLPLFWDASGHSPWSRSDRFPHPYKPSSFFFSWSLHYLHSASLAGLEILWARAKRADSPASRNNKLPCVLAPKAALPETIFANRAAYHPCAARSASLRVSPHPIEMNVSI